MYYTTWNIEVKIMKLVCLMGISNSGKSTVEKTLEQMGFKRSISYTTREPQVRDGKLEQNGVEYMFVTREKFHQLVSEDKIIEYEEYGGNLYGTPRPYGAKRFVAVVCIGGFKALKKIYGDQVVGVYLKCDQDIAAQRGVQRDGSFKLVKSRKYIDNSLLKDMESNADVIIDGNQDLNKVIADILTVLRDRNI